MESPLAAAAGAGLDVNGVTPQMILDVGVHGSEVALLADGRVIDAIAIRAGCRDIEQAVLSHLYRRHQVLAAPHAAWRALRWGSAVGFTADDVAVPVQVSRPELTAQLSVPVTEITAAVQRLACRAGRRTGRDALDEGLVVVGGGGTVPLLLTTLTEELHCPVSGAADPRRAVLRGLGHLLAEARSYPQVWASR
jgi:rod shape-determining protein MreB